ncbi:MAG: nuclear transport factor 2 family protein [Cyanobacteria bacterium P01_A01_bin.84]
MDNPVEKFFVLLGMGNVEEAISLVSENTVFEAQGPSSVPIYGKFHGKEGVKEFIKILGELFDTEAFNIYKFAVKDEYTFAHGYMQHRIRKTDKVFTSEWALVCTTKNGKITSYKMFEDTAALEAAYT